MTKLTHTQLIILSKAAASDDGAAAIPDKMPKAAALKVGTSLIARKLMREVLAKPGMPIWRQDEKGRALALIITRVGRDAIAVEEDEQSVEVEVPAQATGPHEDNATALSDVLLEEEGSKLSSAIEQKPPRAGSKQAQVIAMLSAEAGTTINAIVTAMGWLPHTTRAALTGLRKKGFEIEREQGSSDQPSIYRIVTKAA